MKAFPGEKTDDDRRAGNRRGCLVQEGSFFQKRDPHLAISGATSDIASNLLRRLSRSWIAPRTVGQKNDVAGLRLETMIARSLLGKRRNKIRQCWIKSQWWKHLNFAAMLIGVVEQLHEAISREVPIRGKQRIDDYAVGCQHV